MISLGKVINATLVLDGLLKQSDCFASQVIFAEVRMGRCALLSTEVF